jgi:REP-associated tyrosine transposase
MFHVTARGTGGVMVFVDDVDRAQFTRVLWQSAERFNLRVLAWCLLGTHFHLLVDGHQEQLSRAMHRLIGIYAQGFNRRHGRRGHLFEERFSCWVLESEAHLHASIRYVMQNPVAAGLCRDTRDWAWSWPRSERVSNWTGPSAGEGLSLGIGHKRRAT